MPPVYGVPRFTLIQTHLSLFPRVQHGLQKRYSACICTTTAVTQEARMKEGRRKREEAELGTVQVRTGVNELAMYVTRSSYHRYPSLAMSLSRQSTQPSLLITVTTQSSKVNSKVSPFMFRTYWLVVQTLYPPLLTSYAI